MLGENEADTALDMLGDLAFVEATAEGLALHDAVHMAIVERLRAVDPERFRAYRTAAWHHLQSESRAAGGRDLARSTADLLFLIDNPRVREAVFPTTSHMYSVERSPRRRPRRPARAVAPPRPGIGGHRAGRVAGARPRPCAHHPGSSRHGGGLLDPGRLARRAPLARA